MASVTAVLPLHNEFQNNRLRWQDFANGLIDVSALRADAGTAWIVRFQPSGNGADVATTTYRSARWRHQTEAAAHRAVRNCRTLPSSTFPLPRFQCRA